MSSLNSESCICYLDDITIGSPLDTLLDDIILVKGADQLGLVLNPRKSEIVCSSPDISNRLLQELPGAAIVHPSEASLLGSPVCGLDSVTGAIQEKYLIPSTVG